MDTGERDLEAAFTRLILPICRQDLSNKPIYDVLSTHNLDMILQLKYMPIVMNPDRIALRDWKSKKTYGLCYALSSNEFGDPRFFCIIFYLQSKF